MQHPSTGDHLVVTFPLPKVLQLRLNRPEALNAMTDAMEEDIRKMLDWYEEENSLWAVVITGTGRAFCAGQDLKDWQKTAATRQSPNEKMKANPHGFGSLARRKSKKPIIIAVKYALVFFATRWNNRADSRQPVAVHVWEEEQRRVSTEISLLVAKEQSLDFLRS